MTSAVETPVRQLSISMLTTPASDRLCDTVVLAFGLWTMCSHAVVAAEGSLLALVLLSSVVLTASLWLARRFRAVPAPPDPAELAEPLDWPRPARWALRVFVLVAGVALASVFAFRHGVLPLWWGSVLLLGLAAVAVYYREPPRMVPPDRGRSSEMLLWGLAALGVVLTLTSHRPDADDAFYVNVAVTAAGNPGLALLRGDTLHGIQGLPLHLPVYRVHSYEVLNGAISYLTGIPAIYSFHWLSAAFAALLVPLAHARLFRILTPHHWLAMVATLMIVLVAAGETHRWYGNFAFVRMWQGKAIFLFVFMPLIFAYGLRFAVRPTLRDWALLGAAQVAAVGCSSSALWVAPAGAFMALASGVRPSPRGLQTVVLGGLASGYVLVVAWIVRTSLTGAFYMGGSVARDADPAPLLRGALITVLGDSRLLICAIVALLAAWAFAPPGLARRFAIIAPLTVLLGLLNPYTATWMPANITGPSYWRSMWAVPLPILMALMLTSPLPSDHRSSRSQRAAWLALLAAFTVLVPRFSGVGPENAVQLGWPRLKVPDSAYHWAAVVTESVPERSHVAVPPGIDAWIPTFHRRVYPLAVRYYLYPWENVVSREEMHDRMAIQRFLGAPELVEASPQQFRAGLERYDVRAVCLVNSPRAGAARAILQQAGFRQTLRREDYELWVRPGPEPRARGAGEGR